jgi:hypothetical protein
MKKSFLIAPLALLASACASTQSAQAPAAAPQGAAEAIAAAEAANSKAADVGYEWRDTGKLIASAKKAEAAKDSAKAMELAGLALRQSENALKQQAQQKDAASRN